jgi:hypothetical protein
MSEAQHNHVFMLHRPQHFPRVKAGGGSPERSDVPSNALFAITKFVSCVQVQRSFPRLSAIHTAARPISASTLRERPLYAAQGRYVIAQLDLGSRLLPAKYFWSASDKARRYIKSNTRSYWFRGFDYAPQECTHGFDVSQSDCLSCSVGSSPFPFLIFTFANNI